MKILIGSVIIITILGAIVWGYLDNEMRKILDKIDF